MASQEMTSLVAEDHRRTTKVVEMMATCLELCNERRDAWTRSAICYIENTVKTNQATHSKSSEEPSILAGGVLLLEGLFCGLKSVSADRTLRKDKPEAHLFNVLLCV